MVYNSEDGVGTRRMVVVELLLVSPVCLPLREDSNRIPVVHDNGLGSLDFNTPLLIILYFEVRILRGL